MKKRQVAVAISAKSDIDLTSVLEKSEGADSIHVDIIDRDFADNVANDIGILRELSEMTVIPIGAHIMAKKPSRYMSAAKYSDMLIFHHEIDEDINDIIKKLDSLGTKKGIAINPETNVSDIKHYLHLLDSVQVMGVNPGFSGQKILPETIEKARELHELKNEHEFILIFDGGVTTENARLIRADVIVSGSTILNSPDPKKTIEMLR